jgi:hypothetical protein
MHSVTGNQLNSGRSVSADLRQIATAMLKALDARSQDIIMRRFGIKQDQKETLESIGKEYGITRERVRQIESNAKKALAALTDLYAPAYQLLSAIFARHGGALAESHVVEIVRNDLNQDIAPNIIHFHLSILPDFAYVTSAELFEVHWRHQQSLHAKIEEAVVAAKNALRKHGHPVGLSTLIKDLYAHMGETEATLPRQAIQAALIASKDIAPTAFGEWGLVNWSETSPRGVGDKAYAVLRRHSKPAHFRAITDLINAAHFDHKTANPQTVHNELIKDERFVLVGRGLYGLKEWGYMTGTVADVLEAILRKAHQPLTRDELVDKVLKQRLVKKNTILLSLQNNRRFMKTDENRYSLRERP